MSQIFVIDSFFDDPMLVRRFALAQEFNVVQHNFPGARTKLLDEIAPELAVQFNTKLKNILFKSDCAPAFRTYAAFQLTPEKYEKGWIHLDYQVDYAGVVYLTPDSVVNAGTSVYRETNFYQPADTIWKLRDSFYANENVNIVEYRKTRDAHNANYENVMSVGNVFNRLAIYNGNQYHKEDGFFGVNKNDSRMTLVFFLQIKKEQ